MCGIAVLIPGSNTSPPRNQYNAAYRHIDTTEKWECLCDMTQYRTDMTTL